HRIVEQRRQARIDEVGVERSRQMNVLVAKWNWKCPKEFDERLRDGMGEEPLDRRVTQSKSAEELAELLDALTELAIFFELRRLLRQRERVLEGEPAGLADQLGEEAGQFGDRRRHRL